jgi:ATP-dependent exoDNAse (exonuclease V) beta subunit
MRPSMGGAAMSAGAALGIHLVAASAGSGKTTRLTREVVSALDPAWRDSIPVERLAALTYTRKAAAELSARIQHSLVAAGAAGAAARLPLGYIGTVHAVCLRLLEEHAIDAGLSPHIEALAGDQARLLRQAMERCIAPALRARMDHLASRLQIFWDARVQRSDWLRPVGDIMELARSNRIRPDRLASMGKRSMEALLALFPAPASAGDELDRALARELERADRDLARSPDDTLTTRKVALAIRRARGRLRRGPLPWSEWLKLAKLKPARASAPLVAPLSVAAAACERHPRLRQELAEFTEGAFEAAAQGLAGYGQWKAERRLVDYTDMIDLGLSLAEDPLVAAELASRLALLVVDEFQDTSPLQLALFTRLHALGGRTLLVGDRKQCIFEYAGADPALMEAVDRWVRSTGGTTETLPRNYRSRPELVEATSALFAPAFARFGTPAEEVIVSAERQSPAEQAALPPLGVFWLDSANGEEDAAAMAAGIGRLLARPELTPIVDRETGLARGVRPGDIAVLTATNGEAEAVARALEDRRVGAALARPGLLSTPEGTLADAALRWLLDPADALAGTILDVLAGPDELDLDAYLAGRIAARDRESGAASDEGAHQEAEVASSSWRSGLDLVRGRFEHLSPAETLHQVLAVLDAPTLCARWPEPEQRLGNLDALHALASAYQERCERQREAATLAGLLRYFEEAATPILTRDEERASDEQHVRASGDVVTVSTYHRAKGLEWPLVVLASLDRDQRRSAFDVACESDRASFDPADPLGGRWIRYWPWPYGGQRSAPLAVAAESSPEGRRVRAREDRERVRLLYVGFTRARDHLVLAMRRTKGKPAAKWLDELAGAAGEPLLALPASAADGALDTIRIGDSTEAPARVFVLVPEPRPPAAIRLPARRFARRPEAAARPPYWIAPSRASSDWPDIAAGPAGSGEIVTLGDRARLRRAGAIDWEQAGRAVHAFLAADPPGLAADLRHERATRLLERANLLGHLGLDWLLGASDRLHRFIATRWPAATIQHEVPVTAFFDHPAGRRRIEGTIDLLIDTGTSLAILDHKSFPAWSHHACRQKAEALAPQLHAYARALELLGHRIDSLWFHLPLAGLAVEVRAEGGVS